MTDHLVVVGASLAGLRAVEAARGAGYAGRITLLGAEPHLPYDRPPLSKEFLAPAPGDDAADVVQEPATSLSDHDYLRDELGVEVRLGVRATALDVDAHEVHIEHGDSDHVGERMTAQVGYSALIIATGATARALPDAPALDGVVTLRTLEDARALRAALDTGSRVVIVGAGFIGSEVAAAAQRRGLPVTIVEALEVPLAHAVGTIAGRALTALHERQGTTVRTGVQVAALTGTDRVQSVKLSDGTSLDADVVVVGVGAAPATDWLTGSGLTVDNGVLCDDTLAAVGVPDVYAAGDVARWPNPLFGQHMRLEHWTNAAEQGARAARNALDPDQAEPHSSVPYFWSDWYDSRLQLVGIVDTEHEPTILGDPHTDRFAVLYRRGDHLVGAFALNHPRFIVKQRIAITRRATWHDALTQAEQLI